MNNRQIDNSFLYDKIRLRLDVLPDKLKLKILNAYGGDNVIWNNIKKHTEKNLDIICIDIKDKKHVQLKGDNEKFMQTLDLSVYDIIDLDAYGIPYRLLKIVFSSGFKGLIFFTFIQTGFGKINNGMLNEIGYSKEMIKKCPSLFNKNGFDKFKLYLSTNGVDVINYINHGTKYYGYFKI